MKKIYFDESTYIWVDKLNLIEYKNIILNEALSVIDSFKDDSSASKSDGYGYKKEWNQNIDFIGEFTANNKLDLICSIGINECKKLWEENNLPYNKINTDAWVNMVRAKNPVQDNFYNDEKYHIHTEINKKTMSFVPHYTYVYYIQMPDVMEGDDGVLYFKGENEKEYWIRPEEDDLVIMPGWMPHAPMNAPKSTIDRIVMAGNVGFEFIKKEKSLF